LGTIGNNAEAGVSILLGWDTVGEMNDAPSIWLHRISILNFLVLLRINIRLDTITPKPVRNTMVANLGSTTAQRTKVKTVPNTNTVVSNAKSKNLLKTSMCGSAKGNSTRYT
jgi:hypothetical protein